MNLIRGNKPVFNLHRSAPIADPEPEVATSSIVGTALAEPMLRCYVCGRVSSKNRAINKKERLGICISCDTLSPEEATHRHYKPKLELTRHAEKVELAPDESKCCICKGELISQDRLNRRVQRLTSGDISERDKQRIEAQVKSDGWKFIGNGRYAHNRCLRKNIRRKL